MMLLAVFAVAAGAADSVADTSNLLTGSGRLLRGSDRKSGGSDSSSSSGQCTTTASSVSSAKPCLAAWRYKGEEVRGCTTADDPLGWAWCATAVDDKGELKIGSWGYCEDSTVCTEVSANTGTEGGNSEGSEDGETCNVEQKVCQARGCTFLGVATASAAAAGRRCVPPASLSLPLCSLSLESRCQHIMPGACCEDECGHKRCQPSIEDQGDPSGVEDAKTSTGPDSDDAGDKDGGNDDAVHCCMSMTAGCLACASGLTVGQYCALHPVADGCATKSCRKNDGEIKHHGDKWTSARGFGVQCKSGRIVRLQPPPGIGTGIGTEIGPGAGIGMGTGTEIGTGAGYEHGQAQQLLALDRAIAELEAALVNLFDLRDTIAPAPAVPEPSLVSVRSFTPASTSASTTPTSASARTNLFQEAPE